MKKTIVIAALLASISGSAWAAEAQKTAPAKPQQSTAKPASAKPASPKPATPPAAAPQALAVPDQATQLILVRSTVEAVNQANRTGYYGVVYMLGTDSFRKANSVEAITAAFKPFRDARIDLGAALIANPVLTEPARIEQGKLKLNGLFATKPLAIKFQFEFENVNGRWANSLLNVGLVQQ